MNFYGYFINFKCLVFDYLFALCCFHSHAAFLYCLTTVDIVEKILKWCIQNFGLNHYIFGPLVVDEIIKMLMSLEKVQFIQNMIMELR